MELHSLSSESELPRRDIMCSENREVCKVNKYSTVTEGGEVGIKE